MTIRRGLLMSAAAQVGGGGSDVTPSAINFTDIIVTGSSFELSNSQIFTDIDTTITIQVSVTDTGTASFLVIAALEPSGTSLGSVNSPGSFTFDVDNGDEISFDITGDAGERSAGVITITNVTDNNTVLDTFTIDLDDTGGGSDVTPNAVNWGDIVGDPGATNGAQTISGIDTTITLQVNFTEPRDNYTLEALVNGSSAAGPSNSPGTLTFDVTNNDSVNFRASTNGDARDGVVTVINTSDGNATLDTFTLEVEA